MNSIEKILPADEHSEDENYFLKKGFLIAFCGVDGSGKTTLIRAVQQELESLEISSVVFTNHAGSASAYWQSTMLSKKQLNNAGLPISDDVDRTLQAAEFLAYARHVLPRLLSQYQVVLSDSYDISKITYARVKLDGKSGTAETMLTLATDINQPDLLIYLDVSPETAMSRIRSRGNPEEWNENLAVINKAIQYFHALLAQRDYSVEVNAEKSLDEVKREVMKIVLAKINR